jgi:hypothetical protein
MIPFPNLLTAAKELNMKANLLMIAIILSFALEACTTPYFVTTDELTAKTQGKIVTIVMRDGNQERGLLSYANPDSIGWAEIGGDPDNIPWTSVKTGAFLKIPTSRVLHVELTNNFAWEGGAIGFLLVTVPPLVAGGWGPQYPSRLDEPDYSGRSIIVIGGILGGVVGFGVGSAILGTQEFHVLPVAGPRKTKPDSTK